MLKPSTYEIVRGFGLETKITLMGYTLNMAAVRITVKIALQPQEVKVMPVQQLGTYIHVL